MALPQLDTPTFELKVHSLDKNFKFRPFRVKEEKILMLATNEEKFGDMVRACQQVVTNCSFGELDGKQIPMYDLQNIFLRLREKSIGETQDFTLTCGSEGCDARINYELKLPDMQLDGLEDIPNNKVTVDEEKGIGISLKYPSNETVALVEERDESDDMDLILDCIDHIYDDEQVYSREDTTKEELEEFLEGLPLETMKEIRKYYFAQPVLEHVIDYKCPKCDRENKVSINGYEHFFA